MRSILFPEDISSEVTQRYRLPEGYLKLTLAEAVISEGKYYDEVVGIIVGEDSSSKTFHHPSGSTKSTYVVTSWSFVLFNKLKDYNQGNKSCVLEIPYENVLSIEVIR